MEKIMIEEPTPKQLPQQLSSQSYDIKSEIGPICPHCKRNVGKLINTTGRYFVCQNEKCKALFNDEKWATRIKMFKVDSPPVGSCFEHPVHGIGVFRSKKNQDEKEYVVLGYANSLDNTGLTDKADIVYVPVSRSGSLISRPDIEKPDKLTVDRDLKYKVDIEPDELPVFKNRKTRRGE
jgi:hypothetical protein